jgi:uncharacterized protein (DUF4213/DUF364 family)
MSESEKREINEKIAEMLGFEKYQIINGPMAWKYPEEWKDEVKAVPMTSIPDFLKMLQQVRDISNMYNYGIPSQHISLHRRKSKVSETKF